MEVKEGGGSFRFCPHEHIRRDADFRKVYARRRSASNAWLLIYACENGLAYSRLGLSVSRKVGQATHRNRIRRLYREAFRLTKARLPVGLDLIFIPRQKEAPTLENLCQTLPGLVAQAARKLGVTPPKKTLPGAPNP